MSGVPILAGVMRRGNVVPALRAVGQLVLLLAGLSGAALPGPVAQVWDSVMVTNVDSVSAATSGWAGPVSDARPGIHVFARPLVEHSGYATISQLAGITPGLAAIAGPYGQDLLVSRGGAARLGGRQILMIDGIPINSCLDRSVPLGQELPLLFADRIEIQTGPEALLHGDGALDGFINVVSSRPTAEGVRANAQMGIGLEAGTPADIDRQAREALVHRNRWGGFDIAKWGAAGVAARGPGKEMTFAFGYHAREASLAYGQPLSASADADESDSIWGPYKNDQVSYFGHFDGRLTEGLLNGAGLGFIGLYRETGYGLGWLPQTGEPSVSNSLKAATVIPYFRFDRRLNGRLTMNSCALWNYSRDNGWQENDAGCWAPADSNGVATYNFAVADFNLKASCTVDSVGPLSIIAGVDFDKQRIDSALSWITQPQNNNGPSTGDSLPICRGALYTYSAFVMTRGVVPLLRGLIATAGLRMDNANWRGTVWHQLLPSADVVLKATPALNVKFAYAAGFMAPTLRSYAWNTMKRAAVEDYNRDFGQNLHLAALHPELQHTLQGGISFDKGRLSAAATIFYSIGGNRIERNQVFGASLPVFEQNSRSIVYGRGGELQLRWRPLDCLQTTAGLDYARSRGWYGVNDFLPSGTIATSDTSIGDIHPAASGIRGYLCVDYTAPQGLQSFVTFRSVRPAPYLDLPREPDVFLLDLNFTQPVDDVFSISLSCANVLNHQYYSFRGAVPGANRTIGLSVRTALFP
jgi:outer membrane receptor protein involved in Fe transport